MTQLTAIPFGVTREGETVTRYLLQNGSLSASVLDYGATLQSLLAPDAAGRIDDLVLGYDTLAEYQENGSYLGATVGRYCNRIRNARFPLNGRSVVLTANEGNNQLHGGRRGFDKQVWQRVCEEEGVLTLRLSVPDGEEGFPGALTASVRFSLSDGQTLQIAYEAVSDRDTVVNLTNHAYFNLAGHAAGPVDGHLVQLQADFYTPVDGELLPTGEIRSVAGTALDFRSPTAIGARREMPGLEQGGYDHNYVLRQYGCGLRPAAQVTDPASGRVLTLSTDLPGVQFYTANMLEPVQGKGGVRYGRRGGFCLETQFFPDSPNQSHFPSCLLKAGAVYCTTTTYTLTAGR